MSLIQRNLSSKATYFLDYNLIVPLTDHYSCDIDSLEAESKSN